MTARAPTYAGLFLLTLAFLALLTPVFFVFLTLEFLALLLDNVDEPLDLTLVITGQDSRPFLVGLGYLFRLFLHDESHPNAPAT